MTRTRLALALVALAPTLLAAQGLAARVEGAPAGHVQFRFAARPGVCGNGRTYIQTAPGSYSGTFHTSVQETLRAEACEPGPVRVLVDRAERQVIALQSYVGPVPEAPGVADLGTVPAQEAAEWLLALAAKAEGRVGRDAIFAAMLADSARVLEPLVAIARNQQLPRETRTRALSYAGRADGAAAVPARALDALVSVARDESDNLDVRRHALRALAALPHGAGIPRLTEMAGQQGSAWLAKEGMSALAGSGDPRAREFLRAALRRDDLAEDAMAVAVKALGGSYATPQDAALLRGAYPRLRSDRTRDAALTAIAEVGGAENVRWLLDVARREEEPTGRRRKALEQAVKAGAPIGELVKLYDAVGSQAMKESLVHVFGRSGERAALDKLIAIVGAETNVNVRKRAISALSDSDDPKAKAALQEIVTRS